MSNEPVLTSVLALLAALLFAISNHFQKIGLKYTDSRFGAVIAIGTTTCLCWLAAPFLFKLEYVFTQAAIIFALIGLVRPALSTTLAAAGIKYLGPSLTSGLAGTTPIISVLLAIVILDETLTWPIALGTIAVVSGIFVSTWRIDNAQTSWPIWALALPLGAALFRSVGNAFTKLGLQEVPSPYFAVLATSTISFFVVISSYRIQRRPIPKFGKRHIWFMLTGVLTAGALGLVNSALMIGDLLRVQPLIASTPIFTVMLSYFLFSHEVLTTQTLLTLFLILSGVFFVIFLG